MSGIKKLVYWDTGILVALLADEQRDPIEMQGIEEQVQLFDKNELIIYTSTITRIEVLHSQMSNKAVQGFESLLKRPNFQFAAVTNNVARIAHDIRDYYSKLKDEVGETLSTPDAIHLATAIDQKCDVFYTFDEKVRPGKSRSLVPLNGTIANKFYMKIEKPSPSSRFQPRLPGMKDAKEKR